MASFVRTLVSGTSADTYAVPSPALVLLALARVGVLASQASYRGNEAVVVFAGGEGGSVGAVVEALATLSLYTPPHALGPLPSTARTAAFAAAVEGITVGALLASGWSPGGSLGFSAFVRTGSRRESHSLWLRAPTSSGAADAPTDALTVRVIVEVGGKGDGSLVARATMDTKGGALRITRPPAEGLRGTRVFVLPTLAPCWLAGEEAAAGEQDAAPGGSLLNIPGGCIKVVPSTRALHDMLGISTETSPYGDHEDGDDDVITGPTCVVPREACIIDAIGLRTSTRDRGDSIEKEVYELLVALGASFVKTTDVSDGVDFGAGGAGSGAGAAAAKTTTARPTALSFTKASALFGPGALPAPVKPSSVKTGLDGLLSDGVARKERTNELTIRSAGDMLRGTGGSVLSSDGLHVAPAPPSHCSACFVARERPDCTLSLGIAAAPRSEARLFSLAPLVCADTSAPLALSDILGGDGRLFDVECHYKRGASDAQPLPAVLGEPAALLALDPSFSSSFRAAPHALSIRLGTKTERAAEKVRTLARAGPDEYEDDGRLRAPSHRDGAAPVVPDFGGAAGAEHDTPAPPAKRAKLVKAGPSGTEAAAAALESTVLAAAIASFASDEVELTAASNKALQAYLRSVGLAVSGTKAQLVQRVLARAAKTATTATAITTPAVAPRPSVAEKPAALPPRFGLLDDDDEL